MCKCRHTYGTIEHVIKHCPIVRDVRNKYFSEDIEHKDIVTLLSEYRPTIGARAIVKAYFDEVSADFA